MNGSLLIIIAFSTILMLAEMMARVGVPTTVSRKFAHVSGGLLAAALPHFMSLRVAVTIGIAYTGVLLIARSSGWLTSLFGGGQERRGPVLFPVGLVLTALLWWRIRPEYYTWAVIVFTLADAVAEQVGRRWGRHPYCFTGRKSWEGSLAFFTVAAFLGVVYATAHRLPFDQVWWRLVIGSIVVTVAEGACSAGTDNTVVPVVAGWGFWLLS